MPINYISILRCFALLIIINSHCGAFYGSFSFLGTGGAVGNALFFFTSGYTLCLGNKNIGFGKWMLKRIIRIYPSVWLFLLLSNLFLEGKYYYSDFFITPFWFVNAIFVFYILFYAVIKYIPNKIPLVICILSVPYLLTYFLLNDYSIFLIDYVSNATFLHWYYYFAIMLFGAFCSNHLIKVKRPSICFLLSMFVYFTIKCIIKHFEILIPMQFIIPFGLFFVCKYALVLSKKIESFLLVRKNIFRIVGYLSRLSLETYIVQFSIIAFFERIDIPCALMFVFITVILSADIINRLSGFSRRFLNKFVPIF